MHIRAKLGELRTVYAQIEQSIPHTDSTRSFREWLRDTQDSLARFSATLTVFTFVRRIFTGLWPLVIALVTIGAVWNAIRLYGREVLQPGLAYSVTFQVVIATVYILCVLGVAVQRKRALFLASISISSTWANMCSDSPAKDVVAKNIYEAEDELFSCINKPKRPEHPVDAYLLGAAIFVVLMIMDFYTFSNKSSGERLLLILGVVLAFSAPFSLIYIANKREPR
jgi:CDP-diglyceride synthetase